MFEQLTKYLSSNTYTIAAVVAGIAVVGIGFYLYTKYKKTQSKSDTSNQDKSPLVQSPSREEEPIFVLFHADWCHHCKNMMGEWDKTAAALSGKFNVKKIESSNPELVPHKIESFPTLRMFPRGLSNPSVYVDYKGPRTSDDMIKFALYGPDADRN